MHVITPLFVLLAFTGGLVAIACGIVLARRGIRRTSEDGAAT